jgi:kynurenine 3-monooxygenase
LDAKPTITPPFTLVGSGLAGALLAVHLARAGYRVDLYEKRPDPRGQGQERGRSINLALSVRGIHALKEVGLADEVLRNGILMRGRMIHAPDGQLTFQPYGKDDSEALYSVSRAGLNRTLIEAAGRCETVRLHFRQKCTGVDLATGAVELFDETTQVTSHVPTEILIGADGAYSAVRAQMQKLERFNYRQDYLTHGYKELTIPAGANGTFPMEKHALHIWPRGSFMMIALPNQDGSFTCTLFWPYEGANSFAALKTEADILAFFREQFPDAVAMMPTLAADFLNNPTGALVTIRCQPWHVGGRVALIGDACHAVVPFLGQGMNAAFEDCSVLMRCLAERAPDWEAVFGLYESLRKPNLDVLADLCVENFIEMRDRVASPLFVLKKKLAVGLHRLLPGFLPLYTMIEFTRIPYADALRRARWQARLVVGVLGLIAVVIAMLAIGGR